MPFRRRRDSQRRHLANAELEWDAVSRRYDTLEDLKPCAIRVAGTVGGYGVQLDRVQLVVVLR